MECPLPVLPFRWRPKCARRYISPGGLMDDAQLATSCLLRRRGRRDQLVSGLAVHECRGGGEKEGGDGRSRPLTRSSMTLPPSPQHSRSRVRTSKEFCFHLCGGRLRCDGLTSLALTRRCVGKMRKGNARENRGFHRRGRGLSSHKRPYLDPPRVSTATEEGGGRRGGGACLSRGNSFAVEGDQTSSLHWGRPPRCGGLARRVTAAAVGADSRK